MFGSAYLGPAVSMRTMAMMAWGLPTSGGYAAAMRQRQLGAHARRPSATSIVRVWRVGMQR